MLYVGECELMKKRAKYYYDIADELFKEKDINKYAKINTVSKKGVSISETTIFSDDNPFNKEKGTYCSCSNAGSTYGGRAFH
jgi:hypothetical protein